MLIYQHLVTDKHQLKSFMSSLSLPVLSSLLVQINSCSDNLDLFQEIYTSFKDSYKNTVCVGTRTNELIYKGQILRQSILVSVFLVDDYQVDVLIPKDSDHYAPSIPKALYNQPDLESFIQIFSTMTTNQSKSLLDNLKVILPKAIISGGILSNDHPPVLYYNGKFFAQGYFGLVFYGKNLFSHYFSTSSIIPIGREHVITKANDHIIDTIDNIPAKQFYESYLGSHVHNHKKYGYKFPLIIQRCDLELPTPVRLSDDQDSIQTAISAKVGDRITLGYGDINYHIKEMQIIRKYLPSIPCEYLMTFTSRKRTFDIIEHIQYFNMHLPIFGLLTDFEFITHEETCHITCESTNIFTLATSNHSIVTDDYIDHADSLIIPENDQTILLRLVENTSKELNTLNKTLENMVIQKTNELLDHYYTDQLTKLPNLNKLHEDLAEEKIFALSLIDISAFININNFYGATIGNKVLKELAALITEFNDQNNFKTYRIHSDIFAVASFDASFKLFCNRMKLLQSKIHKNCFVGNNHQIYINTTLAISNMRLALYENTSMTLQHAKAEKISYLIYNEQLKIEDSIISNLTWTGKIRNAITEDRIIPFFQPLYNNELECIDRFEVLMRLVDEDGNIISPLMFLPIAKKAGLYEKLTKIIIKKAFEYFEDKPYKFSINLSAEDIVNSQTRGYIYNKLVTFSHPENVIFEIVESESIENYDTMISFITEVKRYGAQIAIDDFGTGFSNFHYLFKLNVDCIKIDGSIIQQMHIERSAHLVAETIVDFAKKMGISTVAEYVSDEATFDKTRELGIGFAQGYFVARPASDIVM